MTLAMDEVKILEQLRGVDFLGFFSDETLEKLARSCKVISLSPFEVLFEEGDVSNSMYIILSGELLVYKKNKVIARRKPSEYIGEMGLIESEPRSASIRAETQTQLLEITAERFHKEFDLQAQALFALLKTLSVRSRKDLDVMDEMKGELTLAEDNAEKFSQILDGTSNETYILDTENYKITQTNAAASRSLGYSKTQICSKALYEFWEDQSLLEFELFVEPLRTGKKLLQVFEALQKRKDGTVYPVQVKLKLVLFSKTMALLAVVQDLSESRLLESKIKRMAFFDSLTGLPNRNMINDRITLALAHAERNEQNFALLGERLRMMISN
jgi:PAS domain S-box-containing protein